MFPAELKDTGLYYRFLLLIVFIFFFLGIEPYEPKWSCNKRFYKNCKSIANINLLKSQTTARTYLSVLWHELTRCSVGQAPALHSSHLSDLESN